MSKHFNAQSLLSVFPEAMAKDKTQLAIAQATAEELEALFNDNNLIMLYARIDELDEPLLDILAYDFKVDWWNENYSLEEKRETFKSCWKVHRRKGTPEAVNLSISSIYPEATIQEWFEYGGEPFHFKININSGDALTDYTKLQKVTAGVRYYKNKRSVLENIEVKVEKREKIYIGLALQIGTEIQMTVPGLLQRHSLLVDENDSLLTDENGKILIE